MKVVLASLVILLTEFALAGAYLCNRAAWGDAPGGELLGGGVVLLCALFILASGVWSIKKFFRRGYLETYANSVGFTLAFAFLNGTVGSLFTVVMSIAGAYGLMLAVDAVFDRWEKDRAGR